MREIRFRAWDADTNQMLPNVGAYGGVACFMEGGWGALVTKDLPLMQYTGLKDKNGMEIYEGDIVRAVHRSDEGGGWYSDHKETGVVYFDKHWGVKFDCRDHTQRTADGWQRAAYSWEAKDMEHWSDYESAVRDYLNVEIIGNVYEHPNLLTNEK